MSRRFLRLSTTMRRSHPLRRKRLSRFSVCRLPKRALSASYWTIALPMSRSGHGVPIVLRDVAENLGIRYANPGEVGECRLCRSTIAS